MRIELQRFLYGVSTGGAGAETGARRGGPAGGGGGAQGAVCQGRALSHPPRRHRVPVLGVHASRLTLHPGALTAAPTARA